MYLVLHKLIGMQRYMFLNILRAAPPLVCLFPLLMISISLTACSDADWGSCINTCHSLTSYCIFLGGSLISWWCKKQQTVSASSTEAEYRALSSTTHELVWLAFLLFCFMIFRLLVRFSSYFIVIIMQPSISQRIKSSTSGQNNLISTATLCANDIVVVSFFLCNFYSPSIG